MSDLLDLTTALDPPAPTDPLLPEEDKSAQELYDEYGKVESTYKPPVTPTATTPTTTAPAETPTTTTTTTPVTWRSAADAAWKALIDSHPAYIAPDAPTFQESDMPRFLDMLSYRLTEGVNMSEYDTYNKVMNKYNTIGLFGRDPVAQGIIDGILKEKTVNTPPPAPVTPERKTLTVTGPNGSTKIVGYYYQNADGTITKEGDFANELDQMDAAAVKGQNLPTFEDFIKRVNSDSDPTNDINLSGYNDAGLQQLINQLVGGGQLRQNAADEYKAKQAGFNNVEEYNAYLQSQRGQLDKGIGGQTGMSAEEKQSRTLLSKLGINEATRLMRMNLDSVASSGASFANYMMKSDAAINNIRDMQLKSEVELANEDFARKSAEYAALDSRNKTLLESGRMSMEQYFQQDQAAKASALQGYATQISGAIANNQMAINRYQQELATVEMSIQNTYAAVQASLGVQAGVIQIADAAFKQDLADYLVTLQERQLQLQQNAIDAQNSANQWAGISTMFGALSSVLKFLMPVPKP